MPDCAGLTVSQCSGRLNDGGLTSHHVADVTPEQADPTRPTGTLLFTTPGANQRSLKSTDVALDTNPAPPVTDTDHPRDPNCEVSPRYDPGPNPPFTPAAPAYFNAVAPISAGAGTYHAALYYGNPFANWGWRHIASKHGWDSTIVETQVQLALEPDPVTGGSAVQTDGSYIYWRDYIHPTTKAQCTQVVVVENQPRVGQTRAYGIITAWSAGGWNTPPIR